MVLYSTLLSQDIPQANRKQKGKGCSAEQRESVKSVSYFWSEATYQFIQSTADKQH